MECNKDEASRSIEIAEQKFLEHDLIGAKRFAMKAQRLFPELEGLPQLMAVLDVHIIAEDKSTGMEMNWYGILQTDVTADDATIRKQYRRLALILHPDKNKSVGAEGAFKLISEAWSILSDKQKKAAHDTRRGLSSKVAWPAPVNSKGANFANFTYFGNIGKVHFKPPTYWISCPFCKVQLHYERIHKNLKLSCPTCFKVFSVSDTSRADGVCSLHSSAGITPLQTPEKGLGHATSSVQNNRRSNFVGSPDQSNHEMHRESHPSTIPTTDRIDRSGKFDSSCRQDFSPNLNFGFLKARINTAANARLTADMVHQIYESVRKERVKAQKEAKDKAMSKLIEAEREARRKVRSKTEAWKEAKKREYSSMEVCNREQKHRRWLEEMEKRDHKIVDGGKAFDKPITHGIVLMCEDCREGML